MIMKVQQLMTLLLFTGRTADEVCFCPKMRRLLPPSYMVSPLSSQADTLIYCTVQDTRTIFDLAKHPQRFDELLAWLQVCNL